MKKIILSLSIILTSLSLIGQNITFDQLLNIRTKSVGDVEEYLVNRNWKMDEAEAATDNRVGYATFSYNPKVRTPENSALITLFQGGSNLDNRIMVETANIQQYKSCLVRLKELNFILKNSKVLDKKIQKTYFRDDIVVILSVSSSTNEINNEYVFYNLIVFSAVDYMGFPNK